MTHEYILHVCNGELYKKYADTVRSACCGRWKLHFSLGQRGDERYLEHFVWVPIALHYLSDVHQSYLSEAP